MILYHGSKSGIKGEISPFSSRETCDFGRGFHTGELPTQPMGLIAGWKDHVFYELECDFDDLKIKKFDNGYDGSIDWAMFIGFNRDKRYYEGHRKLYEKYDAYNENYDLIIGPIANDKMFQLLERFYIGDLCDKALISGLTQIKLGDQYVFKTKKSCDKDHIKILSERKLNDRERSLAFADNRNRAAQSDGILSQLQTRYRRAVDVKYYDELMEEWDG